MKKLLLALAVILVAEPLMADIQDPPMNAYTRHRKLGRGIANIIWSPSETLTTMYNENDMGGNAPMWSTGVIRGINRMLVRMGVGVYEVVTYPFPTHRQTYQPILRSRIPWINNGYEEYPPEWGWNSRKTYCTTTQAYHY
jgi:putative exosortase-associated protein (TIGR04073 family)